MKRVALLSLAALGFLAGCGFSPAYGPGPSSGGSASALVIPEIRGRTGHVLRQELVRFLGHGVPGAADAVRLDIDMKEGVEFVGYQPDEAASRADYAVSATWTLRNASGDPVAQGRTREAASFNFADAAYNDVAAQTAAKERVALALARTIRQQVLLQVRNRSTAATSAPAPASPAAPPAATP